MSLPFVKKAKEIFPYFGMMLSLVLTITMLVCSACYLVYKITNDRAYREKWKDYNDCGLA